jgi:hypothetical protein
MLCIDSALFQACAFAVSKYVKIIVKLSENDAIDAALLR